MDIVDFGRNERVMWVRALGGAARMRSVFGQVRVTPTLSQTHQNNNLCFPPRNSYKIQCFRDATYQKWRRRRHWPYSVTSMRFFELAALGRIKKALGGFWAFHEFLGRGNGESHLDSSNRSVASLFSNSFAQIFPVLGPHFVLVYFWSYNLPILSRTTKSLIDIIINININ